MVKQENVLQKRVPFSIHIMYYSKTSLVQTVDI